MPNQPSIPLGINPDDLDLLSRTVVRLGGYAEGLFDFHDFGFDKTPCGTIFRASTRR